MCVCVGVCGGERFPCIKLNTKTEEVINIMKETKLVKDYASVKKSWLGRQYRNAAHAKFSTADKYYKDMRARR